MVIARGACRVEPASAASAAPAASAASAASAIAPAVVAVVAGGERGVFIDGAGGHRRGACRVEPGAAASAAAAASARPRRRPRGSGGDGGVGLRDAASAAAMAASASDLAASAAALAATPRADRRPCLPRHRRLRVKQQITIYDAPRPTGALHADSRQASPHAAARPTTTGAVRL